MLQLVGQFDMALAFLDEIRFDPQLVLNTSVEKVVGFIEGKAGRKAYSREKKKNKVK